VEYHCPTLKDLQPGDLIRWYEFQPDGTSYQYAIVIDTIPTLTAIICKHGEQQGNVITIDNPQIDKFYRFNPFNPDEHGSSVAKHNIDYMEENEYIHADFYTYGTPVVHVKGR
jgi:hypothetical protein